MIGMLSRGGLVVVLGLALSACGSGNPPSPEQQARINQRCQNEPCYCVILGESPLNASRIRQPTVNAQGLKQCAANERFVLQTDATDDNTPVMTGRIR